MSSPESSRTNSKWLDSVVQFLDGLLELGERIGILFAVGIVAYAVFQLFFGGDDPEQTRSGKVLQLLSDNWQAALLVIVPVFYRPLRDLLRRITSVRAGEIELKARESQVEPPVPRDAESDSRG